ncbi:MAG: leucyl aminopeptidase family protein [Deltaproteobacteria bacterium]|nr:leucyl aminopeptidase family protein [Deltaproteobacteria bacterium]
MPVQTTLLVDSTLTSAQTAPTVVLVGRAARLQSDQLSALSPIPAESARRMLAELDSGDQGAWTCTFVGARRIVLIVLPEPCSRYNSPSRAWVIPTLLRNANLKGDAAIVLAVDESSHGLAACLAAARAFSQYSVRSSPVESRRVTLTALAPDGVVDHPSLGAGVDGVRLAARLFDMPCAALHTDALVAEAEAVAARTGATVRTVLRGEALRDEGLGGLWGVGKAATRGPALVLLEKPGASADSPTLAWVGKGLVYDTGGLALKGKEAMPGMKGDMGGAAAVLGAFEAACRAGVPQRVLALLCIAENAIGPDAVRPDDVLTMYSGKTVEVNNPDAEGRLVLSDGLAWLLKNHVVDEVIDLATLTGAITGAVGKVHAGVYSNDEGLERALVHAGRAVGEPLHPLIYAPELWRKEFKSEIADMKNSVKDRNNASSAAAAQFILSHMPEHGCPAWAHLDIAGTAWDGEGRGTGFGVGVLLERALSR